MTINTHQVRMGWEDIPNIRETVTIVPMTEIQQDPTKGMAHIIAKDALSRVLRYLSILAAGGALLSVLAVIQTFQEIQRDMDRRDQKIQRLKDPTYYAEGSGTFHMSPQEDDR
jgi:hypothetical protein